MPHWYEGRCWCVRPAPAYGVLRIRIQLNNNKNLWIVIWCRALSFCNFITYCTTSTAPECCCCCLHPSRGALMWHSSTLSHLSAVRLKISQLHLLHNSLLFLHLLFSLVAFSFNLIHSLIVVCALFISVKCTYKLYSSHWNCMLPIQKHVVNIYKTTTKNNKKNNSALPATNNENDTTDNNPRERS